MFTGLGAKLGQWFLTYVLPNIIQNFMKWAGKKIEEHQDEQRRKKENSQAAQDHAQASSAQQAGQTFGDLP